MRVIHKVIRLLAAASLAIVLGAVGFSAVNAQQPQLPSVAEFLANPERLLKENPNGGTLLVNKVQQLALNDASTFKVLLGLVADASEPQKRAIAEGLVQAAKVEVLTDQTLAAIGSSRL